MPTCGLPACPRGRTEQSEFARPFDRFRPLVRPELLVDVAHVRLHRARGQEDFGRDLGGRQVAGQIAKDAYLALGEVFGELRRPAATSAHRRPREDIEDARQQCGVRRAVPRVLLEQLARRREQKWQDERVGFRQVERALDVVLGRPRVADQVAGDGSDDEGGRERVVDDDRGFAGEDRSEHVKGSARIPFGDVDRGEGDPGLGELAFGTGCGPEHGPGSHGVAEARERLCLEGAGRDRQRIRGEELRLEPLRLGERGERLARASLTEAQEAPAVQHEDRLRGLRVRAKRVLRPIEPSLRLVEPALERVEGADCAQHHRSDRLGQPPVPLEHGEGLQRQVAAGRDRVAGNGDGQVTAGLTATLWFNLDATAFQMPLGTLPGLGLMALGAFAGWRLGRNLGDRATSTRLRREAASNRRSAWFAETSPDGSWRWATGITAGLILIPLILLAQATSSAYAPGSPLPVQLLAVGVWALAVIVGDHATISITDAAVRVRARSLSSNKVGWGVSLSEIESARVIAARPEPLTFDRSRCVLRTGPALEIRTVTGGRYAVSLAEASEAVALIEALRSGAPPQTS